MSDRRIILHVDMDAFFASVEIRDDPSLRGKPVLVGGGGRRGVVAAASYEARKFGCHSAQPTAIALRKCPHAIVLPPRFEAYAEASRIAFEVFEAYTPIVEALSIDEAFLDLTGTDRLLGPVRPAVERLRADVRERTGGLTCSVGISSVKFIAKIASDMNKPDGVTEVPTGGEVAFLDPLPLRKLWGVGPKAQERLHEHGIRTIGQLRKMPRELLESWFGRHGEHLWKLANAIDPREVEVGRDRKQVSHEDTFGDDVIDKEGLRKKLLSQATRVADRLVAKRLRGRTVTIKIRDIEFVTQTRQATLPEPTHGAKTIYETACRLLDALDIDGRRFRLTGVSVSGLQSDGEGQQLELALGGPANDEKLQGVLSAVRSRFGHRALFPADATADARPGSAGGITHNLDHDD